MPHHVPVLLNEVLNTVSELITKKEAFLKPKSYLGLDATFGLGGHTLALLQAHPDLKIIGLDYHGDSLTLNRELHKEWIQSQRLNLIHGNFSQLNLIPELNNVKFDFILADLGYSSFQLDELSSGLSFQKSAPLNMLLNTTESHKPTAWDLLTQSSEKTLASILKHYGEIQGAHSLARSIKWGLSEGKIENDTLSLAQWCSHQRELKKSSGKVHPATKVFQALRIAVNDELRNLNKFLEEAILKLSPGGQLMVITFHSLEDRIVKTELRQTHDGGSSMKFLKMMTPTAEEITENPRSRSAKMRIYERS